MDNVINSYKQQLSSISNIDLSLDNLKDTIMNKHISEFKDKYDNIKSVYDDLKTSFAEGGTTGLGMALLSKAKNKLTKSTPDTETDATEPEDNVQELEMQSNQSNPVSTDTNTSQIQDTAGSQQQIVDDTSDATDAIDTGVGEDALETAGLDTGLDTAVDAGLDTGLEVAGAALEVVPGGQIIGSILEVAALVGTVGASIGDAVTSSTQNISNLQSTLTDNISQFNVIPSLSSTSYMPSSNGIF